MTEDDDELAGLFQEVAKLEHEFNLLQEQMTGAEWLEVVRRDQAARQVRRQNELQAYILHAKHIIAERE